MSVYVTGTSGGKLVTIKYSQATGINELINENDFIISPNPSMGIFTVKSNNKIQTIEIINLMGEKIYQSTNQQINNSQIDLSNQPNGIYLLQINSENGFLIRKGIISK